MPSEEKPVTHPLGDGAEWVRRIALHLLTRLPPSVQLDDLTQAGMVGLLEAQRTYHDGLGASFETYAGIRIRGAMLDELRRYDWTPRSVHRKARAISEAIRSIEARTGRDARDAEVAAQLGLPLAEYHQVVQDALSCRVLSIEQLVDASGDGIFETYLKEGGQPIDELARRGFAAALDDAVSSLPDRERLVVSLYYEDQKNLREIGAALGISESRVSQIQGQALLRLRARLAEWRDEQALPGVSEPEGVR
jgi:RNA polymerase sigma factor for flagellar operon FliA